MKELKEKLESLETKKFICECADFMDWQELYAIEREIKAVQEEIKALA